MLADFYKAIQADAHALFIQVEGHEEVYTTRPVFLPPPEPKVTTLVVHSLSGFTDYCKSNRDALNINGLLIHVASPTHVTLVGELHGRNDADRDTFCEAQAIPGAPFPFSRYHDHESCLVGLLSQFAETEDRQTVLKLLGNLQSEAITTHTDDGVTQMVVARTGFARREQVEVPNPVRLRPFRTFAEVEQPESLYVFRLKRTKDGVPEAALFCVEDQRWQLEAIASIKNFLVKEGGEIPVIG